MYILENMTWKETEDALKVCKTAIIPVGSTEQHGPHLPLGTDFFTAQYFADGMADADYPAIVTPTLPLGYATYHGDFGATLCLRESTLEAVLTDICDMLLFHGIDHILFFNTHGGNAQAMNNICYKLRLKGVTAATYMWFETVGHLKDEWKLIGHGDAAETAFVLAYRPGICDPEKAVRPVNRDLSDTLKLGDMNQVFFKDVMQVHFQMRVKDVTDNGAMLEPSLYPGADHGQWMEGVDPQMAVDMRKAILDLLVEVLPEFEKVTFEPSDAPF